MCTMLTESGSLGAHLCSVRHEQAGLQLHPVPEFWGLISPGGLFPCSTMHVRDNVGPLDSRLHQAVHLESA